MCANQTPLSWWYYFCCHQKVKDRAGYMIFRVQSKIKRGVSHAGGEVHLPFSWAATPKCRWSTSEWLPPHLLGALTGNGQEDPTSHRLIGCDAASSGCGWPVPPLPTSLQPSYCSPVTGPVKEVLGGGTTHGPRL